VLIGVAGIVLLVAGVTAGVLVYRGGLAILKVPLVSKELVPDADRDQRVKCGDQIAVTVPFGSCDGSWRDGAPHRCERAITPDRSTLSPEWRRNWLDAGFPRRYGLCSARVLHA
jgi:hypothetical protein